MTSLKKITIDLEAGRVVAESASETTTHKIDTPEAYRLISQAWLRSGWQNNQVYSYTWLGRPIIQLPEDMVRTQEILHRQQPDVLVETGIAHGGSLIFYASLFELMGRGRVIGVDIDIRDKNREALESHPLFHRITLIEGDSIDPAVVDNVRSLIRPDESVFVMLDGLHTAAQVTSELDAYSALVTKDSYIVAADGIMHDLAGLTRFNDDRPTDTWEWDNPKMASEAWVKTHDDFVIEPPEFEFNESPIKEAVTYWPSGWVKRIR
ncbi:MAG: cephalosporin hydroxylase [Chlamydiales bacterium]|jgi:cephalosporin hydroxylase